MIQRCSRVPALIAANVESGGNGAVTGGTRLGDPVAIGASGSAENAYYMGYYGCKEAASVDVYKRQGVVLSVMTGLKGILGLPFFLARVMPQAFLYVPVWCLLLLWGIRRNGRLRIPALLMVLAFVAAGSACEVWLNPCFLGMAG